MPNCIQFFRKSTGEGPLKMGVVDQEIRAYLGKPWTGPKEELEPVAGWYEWVAFWCAMGKSWEWIRKQTISLRADGEADLAVQEMLKIINFMESNYSTNAWAEVGK